MISPLKDKKMRQIPCPQPLLSPGQKASFDFVLQSLYQLLDKAQSFVHSQAHSAPNAAESRVKALEQDLLTRRLTPDMFPLTRQAMIICDGVRGAVLHLTGVCRPKDLPAARFAVFNRGSEADFPPAYDNFAAIFTDIEDAKSWVSGKTPPYAAQAGAKLPPSSQLKTPQDPIILQGPNGLQRVFAHKEPFFYNYVLPNLYFHLTISYALLRQAGVGLGKADFADPGGMPVYRDVPPHI
jgi:uncharacterized protein